MARPTKEQIEQRKKVEDKFKRDNVNYTGFEYSCIREAEAMGHKCFMAYKMSYECEQRTRMPYKWIVETISTYPDNTVIAFHLNDGKIRSLSNTPIQTISLPDNLLYFRTSYPLLNEYDIPINLSPLHLEDDPEYHEQMIHFYNQFLDKNEENFYLTQYSIMPIIEHHKSASISHKSALVNIDFTKPIEEIIAFVSKIKNDFDKDQSTIQHLDVLLGIKAKQEAYFCNFTNCDIYKNGTTKPFEGRLADVLFIYDCHHLGLTKEYTLSEINRYWNDVKNAFTDKMSDKTYRAYLNFAKKQIDDKGYKDFFTGTKEHIDPLKRNQEQ